MTTPPPAPLPPPFSALRDFSDEEELDVRLPLRTAATPDALPPASLDLTGQAKLWLLVGPGRSGKTMLARWLVEQIMLEGREVLLAALDPEARALSRYFVHVEQPPTNEAALSARFLERLCRHVMATRSSGLVDLGGGSTSLHRVVEAMPDLAGALEAAGVAPVLLYFVGPRQDDIATLRTLEELGFQPRATAIVLNEGLADPTVAREEAFGRILRHSAWRAAIERGAVGLWMPRLDAAVATEIEAKRLLFLQARDATMPPGRTVTPLDPFDRGRVRWWLEEMSRQFAPISSWRP